LGQDPEEVLRRLEGAGVGLVVFAGADEPAGGEAVIELNPDGSWSRHAPAVAHPAG
jgi:hypothetical protein